MNADKTLAGSKVAREGQIAKNAAWESRKAAELAAIKAELAARREAFFAA